jgi:nicotinamidase-related amidase
MIWQNQNDASKLLPLMSLGSESWRIVPELAPRPDEVIVDKITMSAFESTFLNIAMRDAGINAFIIAGIALEVGIEPTVRQGLDLNYIPVVVTDACGSKTPELKERSIATLSHTGEVRTVKTTDVIAAMS